MNREELMEQLNQKGLARENITNSRIFDFFQSKMKKNSRSGHDVSLGGVVCNMSIIINNC